MSNGRKIVKFAKELNLLSQYGKTIRRQTHNKKVKMLLNAIHTRISVLKEDIPVASDKIQILREIRYFKKQAGFIEGIFPKEFNAILEENRLAEAKKLSSHNISVDLSYSFSHRQSAYRSVTNRYGGIPGGRGGGD